MARKRPASKSLSRGSDNDTEVAKNRDGGTENEDDSTQPHDNRRSKRIAGNPKPTPGNGYQDLPGPYNSRASRPLARANNTPKKTDEDKAKKKAAIDRARVKDATRAQINDLRNQVEATKEALRVAQENQEDGKRDPGSTTNSDVSTEKRKKKKQKRKQTESTKSTGKLEHKPGAPQLKQNPVAPQLKQNPVAPQLEQNPVAPQLEQNPVAPQLEQNPVAPQLEQNPVAPQLKDSPVAPQGREVYNVEYQGYPKGEIEFHRKRGTNSISWLVSYTRDPEVGTILYNHDLHQGDPFGFLGNSWECELIIKGMGVARFTSVEHLVLWGKARCLQMIPKHFSQGLNIKLSSKIAMLWFVPGSVSIPSKKRILRAFEHLKTTSPLDFTFWMQLWNAKFSFIFRTAIRAKFEQHLDLKIKLMMTGNYSLKLATFTASGGIGYHVRKALPNRRMWGNSVVGEHLETLRAEFRAEEPEWPSTYAFEYFRALEMAHPSKNKVKIVTGEKDENTDGDGNADSGKKTTRRRDGGRKGKGRNFADDQTAEDAKKTKEYQKAEAKKASDQKTEDDKAFEERLGELKSQWLSLGGDPLLKRLATIQETIKQLKEASESEFREIHEKARKLKAKRLSDEQSRLVSSPGT